MPAETHFNDASTWRKLKGIFMNDGGTWRSIKQLWINDAGTWRKVFEAIAAALSDLTFTTANASPAQYRISADGNVRRSGNTSATVQVVSAWLVAGVNTDFQVMVDNLGDTGALTGTTGTWLDCSSDNSWTMGTAIGTVSRKTFRVQIRNKVTTEVLATCNVDMTCDRS